MDRILSPYGTMDDRLIFVCDGARWTWKWVSGACPKAVQILDWYRAIGHLSDFAKSCFKDGHQRKKWMERQKEELRESNVDKVLKTISSLKCRAKHGKESQRQLYQFEQKMSHINRFFFACMSLKNRTVATAMLIFFA